MLTFANSSADYPDNYVSDVSYSAQHLCLNIAMIVSEKGDLMPLIEVVMALIAVGVVLWLINRYIPMQGTIKSILNAVVVIAVVLWLANLFGLFHYLTNFRVGR
jgi:hypothetical protein